MNFPLRHVEEWFNGGTTDILRLTGVFYATSSSEDLHFKSLGGLVQYRSVWPSLVPVSAMSWTLFSEKHKPEHLDLLLSQLRPSLESTDILIAFAEKV